MEQEFFNIQKKITKPPKKKDEDEDEKKKIKKIDKKEDEVFLLTMKTEKGKIIALDVIVGVSVFYLIMIFLILPFCFGYYKNETVTFYQVLGKHITKVSRYYNLPIFFLFVGIVACCFSFNNNDFKKAGLILIIAYITSLAVEAKLFVIGALISGIATYIYIRVLVSQEINKKK